MCGIVGLVGRGDVSVLAEMNASQVHRGPDEGGVFSDPERRVHLAMRRLAIVDISEGHQPMSNGDGSIWIVFNGEIVNAPALRKSLEDEGAVFRTHHSDTEVLVHLYERYGEVMLDRLNGMFAFVVYDKYRNRLFGARDPFGIKPLYYALNAEGLAFASELKSLHCLPGFDKRINRQALYHYLSFQCVPAPNTIFDGVMKLGAGESFVFDITHRQFQKNRYWRPPSGVGEEGVGPRAGFELETVIREGLTGAVRRWMLSDIPIACSLSGGIDSAVIAGLMTEIGGVPIRTYTLGFDDFADLDERGLAKIVSGRWGTQHHEIVIQSNDLLADLDLMVAALDEPYGGGLPSWFVFKGMADDVKVCMTGTGGDELFGSYGKWRVYENWLTGLRQGVGLLRRDWRWLEDYNRFPRGSRYSLYFREYEKRNRLLDPGFRLGCQASETFIEYLWNEGRPATVRDAPRVIDMQVQLPEEFLHMTDRFSMAFSIEARPPFLDREFAETMMSIPAASRMGADRLKGHMIKALSAYIPRELQMARKKGFILPVGDWLRKNLRSHVERLFQPSFLRKQGIFSERIYAELVLPHLESRADHSSKLWTLFMFQLWYEQHIKA